VVVLYTDAEIEYVVVLHIGTWTAGSDIVVNSPEMSTSTHKCKQVPGMFAITWRVRGKVVQGACSVPVTPCTVEILALSF